MKAVIVDIQGKNAAALAENGEVKKIPNCNYAIGDEVSLTEIIPIKHTPRPAAKIIRRVVVVAAALITLTALGFGTAYAVPSGTVSLDADSSIEYTINCFDYVLDVKALNESGETVLNEIDKSNLKHRKIDDAVAETVEKIEKDGQLDENKPVVSINANTGSDNRNEQIKQNLENKVNYNAENSQNNNQKSVQEVPYTPKQEQQPDKNNGEIKQDSEPANGKVPDNSQNKNEGINPQNNGDNPNGNQGQINPLSVNR